jgi:hypothetical protein
MRVMTAGVALAAVIFGWGCEAKRPEPAPQRQVVHWRSLGSWSGRGNAQTGSFPSVTGSMRVEWRTERGGPGAAGTFRLTVHSAVSGRPLLVAVDTRGEGHDTSYVHESPRTFYGVVESTDLDWSFTVEEGVPFDVSP